MKTKLLLFILLNQLLLTSCSNKKFKCEIVNQQLNLINNRATPWINVNFSNIVTTNKSDKSLSCHATINYIDTTHKTHTPTSSPVNYNVYLTDDKQNVLFELNNDSTYLINSTIKSYAMTDGESIVSYQTTNSNNSIYVYLNNVGAQLIFDNKVIEEHDGIILGSNYNLNNKDVFAFVVYDGNTVENSLTIMQIDNHGKYVLTQEDIMADLDDITVDKQQLSISDKRRYKSYIYKDGNLLTTDLRPTTLNTCKEVFIKEIDSLLQNKTTDDDLTLFVAGFTGLKLDNELDIMISHADRFYYTDGSYITEKMQPKLKILCIDENLQKQLKLALKALKITKSKLQ